MMNDFFEGYKDPRFQRLRLEVMQAANFKCERCGTSSVTLNVHHRHYKRGHKPWEYQLDDMACLCRPCHESITCQLDEVKMLAGKLLEPYVLNLLIGYLRGLVFTAKFYASDRHVAEELRGDGQIAGFVNSLSNTQFSSITEEQINLLLEETIDEESLEVFRSGLVDSSDLCELIQDKAPSAEEAAT